MVERDGNYKLFQKNSRCTTQLYKVGPRKKEVAFIAKMLDLDAIPEPTPSTRESSLDRVPACSCRELYRARRTTEITCWDCGKVQPNSSALQHYNINYTCDGNNRGWINPGVEFEKAKFYSCDKHFYTHRERYFGEVAPLKRDALNSPWFKELREEIDLKDRDAYERVRDFLGKRKLNQYYSKIYWILYHLGGQRPYLTGEKYGELDIEIKAIQDYFYSNRDEFGRHNMPAVPYMLECILKQLGCHMYYHMPGIKDAKRQEFAQTFYDKYKENVVDKRTPNQLNPFLAFPVGKLRIRKETQ